MRGTFADALRQATRSSLLSNPSNSTGSRVSSELATTCNRSLHSKPSFESHLKSFLYNSAKIFFDILFFRALPSSGNSSSGNSSSSNRSSSSSGSGSNSTHSAQMTLRYCPYTQGERALSTDCDIQVMIPDTYSLQQPASSLF